MFNIKPSVLPQNETKRRLFSAKSHQCDFSLLEETEFSTLTKYYCKYLCDEHNLIIIQRCIQPNIVMNTQPFLVAHVVKYRSVMHGT